MNVETFPPLTKEETQAAMRQVYHVVVRKDFKEVMYGHNPGEYVLEDDKFFEEYAGKTVYVMEVGDDWFILSDNNYTLTLDCFLNKFSLEAFNGWRYSNPYTPEQWIAVKAMRETKDFIEKGQLIIDAVEGKHQLQNMGTGLDERDAEILGALLSKKRSFYYCGILHFRNFLRVSYYDRTKIEIAFEDIEPEGEYNDRAWVFFYLAPLYIKKRTEKFIKNMVKKYDMLVQDDAGV